MPVQLLRAQRSPLRDTAAHPHEGRPRTVEQALAALLRVEQAEDEDLEVGVGGRVDYDGPAAACAEKDFGDPLRPALSDVREPHARDLRGPYAAGRLLLDPRGEVRGRVAEAGVACELRLTRWHQPLTLAHPVDVVHGESACLDVAGAQYDAVEVHPERPLQRICLGRVVAAQGGVAAADDGEIFASPLRRRREVGRDLTVHPGRYLLGEAARVGKDVERGGGLLQRPLQVFDGPRRQYGDAVDGLGARRVVVEDREAPAALAHLVPDLLQGVGHPQFGWLRGQETPNLDRSRRPVQRRTTRPRIVASPNDHSISGCGGAAFGGGPPPSLRPPVPPPPRGDSPT